MSDFLNQMVAHSTSRWETDRSQESFEDLWDRMLDVPPPVELELAKFDLICECKLASPSEGVLAKSDPTLATDLLIAQAQAYEQAGAAAISVLTEPSSFLGSLDHLQTICQAVSIPVMRKDFLVADYQVVQARAAGASGVLLIVRMLSDDDLFEMLDLSLDLGMFALIESFDETDLARLSRLLVVRGSELAPHRPTDILIGVNCRNLADLSVDPSRFASLQASIPKPRPAVAESSIITPQDAADVAALGYRLALVGSSLMKSANPTVLAEHMLAEGRKAAQTFA